MNTSTRPTWATSIQRHRGMCGLTQRQVALELGVTHQTVWAWEHGKVTPNAQRQAQLVALLGIGDDEIAAIVRAEDGDAA